MSRFWVTLEGRDAEVDFHVQDGRVWLDVAGRRIEADVRRLPDGEVYSLLVQGASYEVRVSPGAEALDVTVRGVTLPVEVRHPLEKRLHAAARAAGKTSGETIAAPMPGVVVAIRVKPGDVVAPGQAVIVVEAMKMQNELASRHGGVVAEVRVAERASVSAGQPLVRIQGA